MDIDGVVNFLSTPVFQKKRLEVRQSHLRFFDNVDMTDHGIKKRITTEFIRRRQEGRDLSKNYINALLNTLAATWRIEKGPILKYISQLKKVFNNENPDSTFFNGDGVTFKLPDTLKLPEPTKIDKTYSDSDYIIIKEYYRERLEAFLQSNTRPTEQDELSMIVTILSSIPNRISEILSITVEKAIQLSLNNPATVKSKTGSISIRTSYGLSVIFGRYISTLSREHYDDRKNLLFKQKYKRYYELMKRQLPKLINNPIGKRPFHNFRNIIAKKITDEKGIVVAQDLCNHASASTTRHYNSQQNKSETGRLAKDALEQMWNAGI